MYFDAYAQTVDRFNGIFGAAENLVQIQSSQSGWTTQTKISLITYCCQRSNYPCAFGFHAFDFPLSHFHYDRFDTPDDEQYGKFSVNFRTNPQGDINGAVISLDQAEVVFTRKPETLDPALLEKLAGAYVTPTKVKFEVLYQPGAGLSLSFPGGPPIKLIPLKGLKFRTPQFADIIYEFVMENGKVTALKQRNPSGEFTFPRQ